ncbi:MAG TPA: hypothetical protein DEQ43_14990, partial [Nocardioides bacterium]|nr:hypothetical protein [Nocardioides sp.]
SGAAAAAASTSSTTVAPLPWWSMLGILRSVGPRMKPSGQFYGRTDPLHPLRNMQVHLVARIRWLSPKA